MVNRILIAATLLFAYSCELAEESVVVETAWSEFDPRGFKLTQARFEAKAINKKRTIRLQGDKLTKLSALQLPASFLDQSLDVYIEGEPQLSLNFNAPRNRLVVFRSKGPVRINKSSNSMTLSVPLLQMQTLVPQQKRLVKIAFTVEGSQALSNLKHQQVFGKISCTPSWGVGMVKSSGIIEMSFLVDKKESLCEFRQMQTKEGPLQVNNKALRGSGTFKLYADHDRFAHHLR